MAAIVRLFVDSQRLIARSQNRTKCVKYVWLSYPTWPSRWLLCISMQWPRLKACHVACDEWTSGEICSLQHMWVIGSVMWAAASDESLKFGVHSATATNWFPRVNGAQDNRIWLYHPFFLVIVLIGIHNVISTPFAWNIPYKTCQNYDWWCPGSFHQQSHSCFMSKIWKILSILKYKFHLQNTKLHLLQGSTENVLSLDWLHVRAKVDVLPVLHKAVHMVPQVLRAIQPGTLRLVVLHTETHIILQGKAPLVQVMAGCHQTTSHYLNQLEQLERLHSEIPPAAPRLHIPVIHIRSQVKKRRSQSSKFLKIAKIPNFENLQGTLHATHLLKLLDKM